MIRHYGLQDDNHAVELVKKVVRTFGGGHKCVQALIGIACAETHLGRYPDSHPDKWGVGLTQFDQIGLDDVKARTRSKDKKRLYKNHGYDLDKVELADLANDPELAFCIARLKYKLRPEPIPADLDGQAHYWKRWYNSYDENAAGTPEKYIAEWERYAPLSVRF